MTKLIITYYNILNMMKYFTFLALLSFANVEAVEYDYDGNGGTKLESCSGEDCWYMQDEVVNSDMTREGYSKEKEFVMLSAMNANQTADADGSDELGEFKIELFKNSAYVKTLFSTDLSDATENSDFGTYANGWEKEFS